MSKDEEVESFLYDHGFIKEANLIKKIRTQVRFGRISIVTRDGRIQRIEQEVKYDDLSEGF